jgi:hypothetical protein
MDRFAKLFGGSCLLLPFLGVVGIEVSGDPVKFVKEFSDKA